MPQKQRRLLILVLLFTAAQSILRLAVVPLWAHYDESGHFEYLRFIVEHRRLPQVGDADWDLLRRIAAAGGGSAACGLTLSALDPKLCMSPGLQFSEMPGYYVLQ